MRIMRVRRAMQALEKLAREWRIDDLWHGVLQSHHSYSKARPRRLMPLQDDDHLAPSSSSRVDPCQCSRDRSRAAYQWSDALTAVPSEWGIVVLQSATHRTQGMPSDRITGTSLRHQYWTVAQMLARSPCVRGIGVSSPELGSHPCVSSTSSTTSIQPTVPR